MAAGVRHHQRIARNIGSVISSMAAAARRKPKWRNISSMAHISNGGSIANIRKR